MSASPALPDKMAEVPALFSHYWNHVKDAERDTLDYFVSVDKAHVLMLVHKEIIPELAGQKILAAIERIQKQGASAVPHIASAESFFFEIEDVLKAHIGAEIAPLLHTARSRIDQSGTTIRMHVRDLLLDLMEALNELQNALVDRSVEHATDIMNYQTCQRPSQPGTFAHFLLYHADALMETFARFKHAYGILNQCPLGGVGRSGTGFPIDRELTARWLGFDRPVRHSLSVRDATYAHDILAALCMLMTMLNHLCADLEEQSKENVGYIGLADAYTCRSSLFPGKSNPMSLNVIRKESAEAIGLFTTCHMQWHNMGTWDHYTYDAPHDLEEGMQKASKTLTFLAGLIPTFTFNAEKARHDADASWTTLSNLPEHLYKNHNIPVRIGYQAAKDLNIHCLNNEIHRKNVTAIQVNPIIRKTCDIAFELTNEDVTEALDPQKFVNTRISQGGVGPEQTAILHDDIKFDVSNAEVWLRCKREQIDNAKKELQSRISKIMPGSASIA